MKFVFDQLRFSFGTYLAARSFGSASSFPDWALTCIYFGRPVGTIASDQPMLIAFYGLSMALYGDLGIAISLAAEGSLVRSKLQTKLGGLPDAENVIRRSLEDLNNIRNLPLKVQAVILEAFVSSTEAAFGISCLVLFISLVASFFVREMPPSPRGLSYMI
ncbi:hypothetical protein B0T16DRAFT_516684 [Cercophora newfieldiana]|uniref:Uncharacterized protein n=1 Tax=Cercophora newfieldiana TaxID=92897 RepID=A0AA39XXH4_9PEZI|nr:hypothetical protein B0T16DRAFT_516684 [Cercophora newfieldiana]